MLLDELGFLTARKARSAVPVSPMSEHREPGALNGFEGNPDEAEEEMGEVRGMSWKRNCTEEGQRRQESG